MLKKTKCIFLALFLFLFLPVAMAASFKVDVTPIVDSIVVTDDAKFEFKITNNREEKQEFKIFTLDFPFWDIRTEPLINPIILEIPSESSRSIELLVDPLHVTQVGAYVVGIYVRSLDTQDTIVIPVEVGIISTEPLIGGYIPTIVTSLAIPEKIDPRKSFQLRINLNNQNMIDYPELTIEFKGLFTETITESLKPKEEKTVTFEKNIEPLTEAQKGTIVITAFKGDRVVVDPIVKQVEVLEYKTIDHLETKKGFLRTKKEFLFTSNNKNYKGQVEVETTLFKSLFTSTNPNSKTIARDNKRFLVWELELENTNSMSITVTENLLPLLIIIILIVVMIALYCSFRSPLTIRKEAKSIKKSEGGISELKVVLHLRNRGNVPIKEIDMTERVPNLVHVEKEVSIGTIHPEKILRHEKKSTIIKWRIESLDPGEERVLTYKISSKLPILGSLTLSAAGTKFHFKGKVGVTSSNRLNVEA